MKVEILGTGCPKCKKVIELTDQAAKELGIEIESIKVTDIKEIANRGVMMALLRNEVKSGSVKRKILNLDKRVC